MKVTNKTAYATIGCDVQLTESDRLALGIELDKVTNWLIAAKAAHATVGEDSETEPIKAINNIVAFVSKFAIRPSETNVFTDSPEEFKKADETTTAVEPVPAEDNVITVAISKNDNLENLTKIIYHATDANKNNIIDLLNSSKYLHIPNISFECTGKSKKEVIDELVDSGYRIIQNTAVSLQLETYMPNSDKD